MFAKAEEQAISGSLSCGAREVRSPCACVFKMDNQQGPAVEHRELCSMLCGSLDGGEFGGERIHIYI